MPIVIKIAQSSNELKETLNFRYKVAMESNTKLVNLFERSLKICDHFDSYPDTVNSVAYVEGECVANLRAVKYGPVECMNNTNYDFSGSFNQLKSNVFLLDIVTISKKFRNLDLLFTEMLKSIFSYLGANGGRYVFLNSPVEYKEKLKLLGFSFLQADVFDVQEKEGSFIPLVIDLESYNKKNLDKVLDKEILKFSDVFYRTIFFAGELIVLEGEKGTAAYLLETGEVEIITVKNDQLISLGTISEGCLIGEVAMATGDRRTASIIAKTMTSCMAFDRAEFVKNIYKNPSKLLDFLKIFSKRLKSSNQRIATVQNSSAKE